MLYMLQNCTIIRIIGVFFTEPIKSHYLIEISKKARIAHTSVMGCLAKLQRLNLIIKESEKKGKRTFPLYKANITNPQFRKYKILYNLFVLEESKIISFIKDTTFPKSIVIFGSYRRGEDTEESDIDIFVQAHEKKLDLKQFEHKLKRKIQLHFKDSINSYAQELKNNIINGIVLEGYLEVF